MGIFDMPELAFVYHIGKLITRSKLDLLGSNDYTWMRITDFGNGGPTNLAFITNDKSKSNYAIEFKLDDTCHAYLRDIKKLRSEFTILWKQQN